MSDIRAGLADVDFSKEEETREARHELLASFLGAYADGELPPETQSQIDAHLTGCARCRRELEVHRALRDRLGNEPVPAASAALRDRIVTGMKSATPPVLVASEPAAYVPPKMDRTTRRKWMAFGLAIPLIMLGLLVAQAFSSRGVSTATTAIEPSREVQLLTDVMTDYRQVVGGDLPGRSRDLDAVRAAVPFPFEAISHPSVRLVRAWTTSLSGEPVAVLAYRWKDDRMVLQYFVSEALLFQSSAIRSSLALQRPVSLKEGAQGMLLWAEPQYGTILVGDFAPEEFAALRESIKAP